MSVRAEQLELFTRRTPHKPYCTDDLSNGLIIRTKSGALRRRYVQMNPPHLRFWMIFDIDRPGGAFAADDGRLAEPNAAVINPQNAHAHLLYALDAPVLVDTALARQGPIRYLASIENAYRAVLEADPAYGGCIAKNALHQHWKTLWGPIQLYGLNDLAEWADLSKHQLRRGVNAESYGLGRNCSLFDQTRVWSYRARLRYDDYSAWFDAVYDRVGLYNSDFPTPLDEREWRHIAKSVAKWVWVRFSMEAFRERQALRGARKGKKIRDQLLEKAVAMSEQGLSQVAISRALEVPRATVQRWLKRSHP